MSDSMPPHGTAASQASLSFTVSWNLLTFMSIESMMPSNHLILCPTFLLLPSIFPNVRVFSSELALCIRWPKYWRFSFSINPSNKYSELISFAWLVWSPYSPRNSQESSPEPQFKIINSLVLSLLYGPTITFTHDYWKNHSYDHRNFGWKLMSLLFNMLSILGINCIPRSKHLLISWIQSSSAMILEPKKIKSATISIFSSSICHEAMGLDAMILVSWNSQS